MSEQAGIRGEREKERKIGVMLLYLVIEDTRPVMDARSLKPDNPDENV